MSKRREGRETAVQYLFQLDHHGANPGSLLAEFWELQHSPEKVRAFAEQLIAGVQAHQAEIDAAISKYAANYQLHRIAAVDRNILRVGIYEMMHALDVPPVVAINEAIELAKKFGSEDSGKFVNGILDRIRHTLQRPSREAAVPFEK